jgi:putative DNA primase/helicase
MNDYLSPVEKVLDRLEEHREYGGGFRARCPAHQGNSDTSLSIKEGDDGRALLTCHASCGIPQIVDALGLGMVDLFTHNGSSSGSSVKKVARKTSSSPRGDDEEILTTDDLPDGTYWEFTAPSGEVLYIQRHKGAYYQKICEDRWKKGLDGVTQVLYGLHELVDGVRAGKTIYHFEGPKDVETARSKLGVVGTTSGGVKTWRPEFRSHYIGADVVIVPDNDNEGRQYAETVAQSIAPVAKRVRVAELPGLPEKGDLTDWLEAGHTAEEFFYAVDAAPDYDAEGEAPWPAEPTPLNTELPPVEPFTENMLPEPLAAYVVDAAYRMDRVAPDFIAAPLVVAAGSILGRKIVIRPKSEDDWEVVPNLWGANVGRPSSMKTPAQNAGLAAIDRIAADASKAYKAGQAEASVEGLVSEAKAKHWRDELKKAITKGDGQAEQEAREQLLKITEDEEVAREPRYSTSDATIEKLGELLRDNPNGLLNDRDELMGWLSSLDRGGREGDRAFFLESWNGNKPYNVDRIGRGSVHIPALCLSIFGGIQPGPLSKYVRAALEEAEKADGLLQRFQVLVWPDIPAYERTDKRPDPKTRDAVYKVFKKLVALDGAQFGTKVAEDPDDSEEEREEKRQRPSYVRFSKEAQEVYNAWRDELEPRMRSGGYPAAYESHLLKYKSLFPSLALIFEVVKYVTSEDPADAVGGVVGKESAVRAAAWCQYLESHAYRLYSPAIMAPVVRAEALLGRIKDNDVDHLVTTRELWKKNWELLDTRENLQSAIEVLEEHGYVRREEQKNPKGGRPSEVLAIHPSLRSNS